MIDKIKAKMHIIVMTIIIIYLVALGIKTGHLVYTEYYMGNVTGEIDENADFNK